VPADELDCCDPSGITLPKLAAQEAQCMKHTFIVKELHPSRRVPSSLLRLPRYNTKFRSLDACMFQMPGEQVVFSANKLSQEAAYYLTEAADYVTEHWMFTMSPWAVCQINHSKQGAFSQLHVPKPEQFQIIAAGKAMARK
jgi:hypothetical protein